jgi:single-stranded DNA-binding protein
MKIVTVIGRMVRPPRESKDPETGTPLAFATIEVTTGRRENERSEKEYVDLVVREQSAQYIMQVGKPNLWFFVSGREHLKRFTRRDGTPDAANEIFVTSLEQVFPQQGHQR